MITYIAQFWTNEDFQKSAKSFVHREMFIRDTDIRVYAGIFWYLEGYTLYVHALQWKIQAWNSTRDKWYGGIRMKEGYEFLKIILQRKFEQTESRISYRWDSPIGWFV